MIFQQIEHSGIFPPFLFSLFRSTPLFVHLSLRPLLLRQNCMCDAKRSLLLGIVPLQFCCCYWLPLIQVCQLAFDLMCLLVFHLSPVLPLPPPPSTRRLVLFLLPFPLPPLLLPCSPPPLPHWFHQVLPLIYPARLPPL